MIRFVSFPLFLDRPGVGSGRRRANRGDLHVHHVCGLHLHADRDRGWFPRARRVLP